MIGRLKGELIEKQPPHLLLDLHGVGYEVEASMNTFFRLPDIGQIVVLHTHFVVREDAQLLYGFIDKKERSLFRSLIKANGVGPKMAISILSGMTTEEFIGCLQREDAAALTRIPGVGKKTAERLIVELKDKLKILQQDEPADFQLTGTDLPNQAQHFAGCREEAESALVALGYKPVHATKAVIQAEQQLGMNVSTEELIRLALKSMISG
ncbi:Holliday junction branch migration protein RuvA [Neptunomonas qingdaonensis]|uniref:Holliday junction branch migration complex subunit RuvA n=1 Tax=Neptunomonas qingdaonensis TaxID=1045558 RepID=A0A1I2UV81_9GAMM|nr:Holliday junction branch migration protein RuvA [Neptunomonas qingdaonensis]SFG81012.1 Holliday junction DNA helicase subunit RuvA [Neptunomonas qingdaonensis]